MTFYPFCSSVPIMAVNFDSVLLIGDSNLRYVGPFLPEIKSIVARGCVMYDQSDKYKTRVLTPLRQRLGTLPSIRIMIVMFGTNNLSSTTSDQFLNQVEAFIAEVRSNAPNCRLIFSSVIPRKTTTNEIEIRREWFNDALKRVKDEFPNTECITITGLTSYDHFQGRVHLSESGAQIVATQWRARLQELMTPPSYSQMSAANRRTTLAITIESGRRVVREALEPVRGIGRDNVPMADLRDRSPIRQQRPPSPESRRTVTLKGPSSGVAHHAQAATRDPQATKVCVFNECKKPYGRRGREHFFRFHMPQWLREVDGVEHMPKWAHFFRWLLNVMGLKSLDELYQKVLQKGWYPVNRSAEDVARDNTPTNNTNVHSFARYLSRPLPLDFAETVPKSAVMMMNWRILRCILHFGLTTEIRKKISKLKRPKDLQPDYLH